MPKVSTFIAVSPVPTGAKFPLLVPSGPAFIQRLASHADVWNVSGANVRLSSGILQIKADDGLWYDVTALRSQGFTVMEIGQTGV